MFNGRSSLLDSGPIECSFTDASHEGAGGLFQGDLFYFNCALDWPEAKTFHMNEKEVVAVTIAAYRWALLWRNKRVIIYFDNSVTVSALNKGSCRNATIMKCLSSLFRLSAIFIISYFPLCLHMSPSTLKFLFDRYRSWSAEFSKGSSSVDGHPPF